MDVALVRIPCGSSYRKKKNVKKTLYLLHFKLVPASACGEYDIFIFVIFSGGFVEKVITSVFDASENLGN